MGSEKRTPSEGSGANFEWASRLFEEHGAFIRSVIRFAVSDSSEYEDFYQDLYLSFALNPFTEELRNPRGFLYRVIVDRAKDRYRIQSRRRRWRYELFYLARQEYIDRPEGSDVIRHEEAQALFHRIETHLSRNEARAILYRYKYDYSLEETAREMGVKPKTISRYISVGLKKMKHFLHKKERG